MEAFSRACVALALSVLSTSIVTAVPDPITEAEAIRLFLETSPQARQVPLTVRAVDAELRVEARVANPEFLYHVEDAAAVRDEFLTFQQELPVTGRRGLLGQRATVASRAAGLAAERDLQTDVYDLKQAFYEVLFRERALERLRNGALLMERTVEVLVGREREGEGSGYDALRAEQELATFRLTAVEAEGALAAARARFGSFYDPDSGMETARLEGDLSPSGPVPDEEWVSAQAVTQRLDMRALAAEREGMELQRRAARRRRYPEPTLVAGWKRSSGLGVSDTGYVAALLVPLPFSDNGRLDTIRATAEGQRVDLAAEVLTRRIRADVQAAVARERAALRAAQLYGEGVERRAVELQRIAQIKYDEGESGILELLDAHRTFLEMELRALTARYEAKSAEIDRERAVGDEVTP